MLLRSSYFGEFDKRLQLESQWRWHHPILNLAITVRSAIRSGLRPKRIDFIWYGQYAARELRFLWGIRPWPSTGPRTPTRRTGDGQCQEQMAWSWNASALACTPNFWHVAPCSRSYGIKEVYIPSSDISRIHTTLWHARNSRDLEKLQSHITLKVQCYGSNGEYRYGYLRDCCNGCRWLKFIVSLWLQNEGTSSTTNRKWSSICWFPKREEKPLM